MKIFVLWRNWLIIYFKDLMVKIIYLFVTRPMCHFKVSNALQLKSSVILHPFNTEH